MARSKITNISNDLTSDGGGVLISLIQGEQDEFPITLNFVDVVSNTYTFEAVLIEGENDGSGQRPATIRATSPNKAVLTVRVPLDKGVWSAAVTYLFNDYVEFGGSIYIASGAPSISIDPVADPDNWTPHVENRVFIQFGSALSVTPAYAVQPAVGLPVYGFLEMRVTEPNIGAYTRTWKPLRGLVEFLFSPTAQVP
ncbi:MAG: hypothetical protein OEX12_00055 [Gammaproteobacteria bacterium]|nr:hypothetical protein [Gammaproteobacteria bacterium]